MSSAYDNLDRLPDPAAKGRMQPGSQWVRRATKWGSWHRLDRIEAGGIRPVVVTACEEEIGRNRVDFWITTTQDPTDGHEVCPACAEILAAG